MANLRANRARSQTFSGVLFLFECSGCAHAVLPCPKFWMRSAGLRFFISAKLACAERRHARRMVAHFGLDCKLRARRPEDERRSIADIRTSPRIPIALGIWGLPCTPVTCDSDCPRNSFVGGVQASTDRSCTQTFRAAEAEACVLMRRTKHFSRTVCTFITASDWQKTIIYDCQWA